MPLKIIGAGFGRTGTMSLYTALKQLGFPCYHMIEMIGNRANKSHLDFWHRVANGAPGTQYDWQRLFSNYSAALDNPACCVWRELLAAYPDAKVILTVHPRGADTWYDSTIDTIYFTENLWQFKVLELITPLGKKMGEMSRKLIWQRSLKGTMNDRHKAIERYYQHIEEVKAAVPPRQLLIYSVEQGWQPLCAFLGMPEPSTKFPSVNDRTEMKRRLRAMRYAAYFILGAAVAAIAGAIYGLTQAMS